MLKYCKECERLKKQLEECQKQNEIKEKIIKMKSSELANIRFEKGIFDLKEIEKDKVDLLIENNHLKYLYYEQSKTIEELQRKLDLLKGSDKNV